MIVEARADERHAPDPDAELGLQLIGDPRQAEAAIALADEILG